MAVENLHKNLPEASLHNPKGFSTAANDTYLTKDASGNIDWASKPNGARLSSQLSIGDWNMDTTASVNVAHSLSATEYKTIRNVCVVIRDDADSVYYFGNYKGDLYYTLDSTNFVISRVGTGTFDTTDFDSTSYNRGYITFEYTAD